MLAFFQAFHPLASREAAFSSFIHYNSTHMQRRELLKYLSVFPLAGGAAGLSLQAMASPAASPEHPSLSSNIPPLSSSSVNSFVPPSVKRDIFKELGVRTFINAAGTFTAMTGSLMHDYVLETINDTSKDFCMLDEMQDKVG